MTSLPPLFTRDIKFLETQAFIKVKNKLHILFISFCAERVKKWFSLFEKIERVWFVPFFFLGQKFSKIATFAYYLQEECTVENVTNSTWSCKVVWFLAGQYCSFKNHATFHDHCSLITISTVRIANKRNIRKRKMRKNIFVPALFSAEKKGCDWNALSSMVCLFYTVELLFLRWKLLTNR